MKELLLCLARVLVVVAIQAPLTVRSAPGEVTSAGKQFVELLAKEDHPRSAEYLRARRKQILITLPRNHGIKSAVI